MSDPNDYTIGWICALHVEYVAAQEFLDEEHEAPHFVAPNDTNDYTLGAIGKHNIVIAVLPDGEYGTASAASVATNLLHSFRNIRIGLMVGIGGGAPGDAHDIRLGDIVVSATRTGEGGVFQYDFGKTIQNQAFKHTRVFNQPSTTLRTAIAGLRAQYKRKGHRLAEAINCILERNVRLRQEFGRPRPETDRLMKRDITHDSRGCADFCAHDPSNLVQRCKRTDQVDNPTIHYGIIASANQLMKDATIRDKLAAEKDVLCFEMEAAGLIDQFPCLVIRGICDYSDSHKSKEWQGYAALAAAAYARDLLQRIPPNRIEAEKKMNDILSQALTAIRFKLDTNDDQELLEWLAPVTPKGTHVRASKLPTPGTGSWFIDNDLQRWLGQDDYPKFLFLRGKSGVGKTTLFANIVQKLASMNRGQPNTCLAYFYCTLGDAASQEPVNIIGSLAAQLSFTIPSILDDLRPIFAEVKRKRLRHPIDLPLLERSIIQHCRGEVSILILIDAIDESMQWKEVVHSLLTFSEQLEGVHILVSTTEDAATLYEICPQAMIVDMKPATVHCDIETHVHQYLENDENLMTIDADVKADIKSSVLNGAHGSFRWVQLSLENLSIQRTKSSLYHALQALPGSLQGIYETILDKISLADQKLVREALLWLSFAKRPLTLCELNEAVVFEESYTSIDDYNLLISSRVIPRISKGLIELDNDQVYLAHSSIKELLTSDWIRGSKVRYFALDSGTAHKNVMRKCISYLCLDYFRCGYKTSDNLISDCLIKDRPLLEYAAHFWAVHGTSYNLDGADRRLITQLFHTERLPQKGNFGFWVQILIPDAGPEDIATTQPLYYAASFGLVPVVKAILGSVPNLELDSPGGRYGSTPLFVACWRRQYEVVKLLLEAGANTNVVDPSSGHTVFSFAMEYDDHLEHLLTENASQNALTKTSHPTIGPVYIDLVEVALAKESTVKAWGTIRVSRQAHAEHRFRLMETCSCRGEPSVEESRVIEIDIRKATLIPIYAEPVGKAGKTRPLEIVLEDKASSYRFLFVDLRSLFLFQQALTGFEVAESYMESRARAVFVRAGKEESFEEATALQLWIPSPMKERSVNNREDGDRRPSSGSQESTPYTHIEAGRAKSVVSCNSSASFSTTSYSSIEDPVTTRIDKRATTTTQGVLRPLRRNPLLIMFTRDQQSRRSVVAIKIDDDTNPNPQRCNCQKYRDCRITALERRPSSTLRAQRLENCAKWNLLPVISSRNNWDGLLRVSILFPTVEARHKFGGSSCNCRLLTELDVDACLSGRHQGLWGIARKYSRRQMVLWQQEKDAQKWWTRCLDRYDR